MARAIQDFQNVDIPSAEFPLGNIRDDDGTSNGTPVNKQVKSDLHQFFGQMMLQAGIVPNGLPDSSLNGYQLIEALKQIPTETTDNVNKLHGLFNEQLSDIGLGTISSAKGVFLSEGRLYVSDDTEIKVFDPLTGSLITSISEGDTSDYESLFILGNNIHVIAEKISTGLKLIRVIDKISGLLIDSFAETDLEVPRDIFIKDNKAYITEGFTPATSQVLVYDLSTGLQIPGEFFGAGILTSASGLFLAFDRAYVTDTTDDIVYVFDVSSGNNLASENFGGSPFTSDLNFIHLVGVKAYVTGIGDGETRVFDVSNQTELSFEEFDTGGSSQHIFIGDNKCFLVNDTNTAIKVFQQNLVIDHV